MTPQEIGTAELRRSADETAWRDFWLTNVAQERGERSSQWKQDGVKALSEYADQEQATRILTVKLRAERFAREAVSAKQKKGRESVSAFGPSITNVQY